MDNSKGSYEHKRRILRIKAVLLILLSLPLIAPVIITAYYHITLHRDVESNIEDRLDKAVTTNSAEAAYKEVDAVKRYMDKEGLTTHGDIATFYHEISWHHENLKKVQDKNCSKCCKKAALYRFRLDFRVHNWNKLKARTPWGMSIHPYHNWIVAAWIASGILLICAIALIFLGGWRYSFAGYYAKFQS